MNLISNILFMGAKLVMGGIAQNANLVAAFMLPTVLLFAAGLISGVLAKRASADKQAIEDAFPITGQIGVVPGSK
jgi:hypothetical protein